MVREDVIEAASASGDGYLLERPEAIAAVDAFYPHAVVDAHGAWRADARPPAPARDVPDPWGGSAVVFCADRAFYPGLVAALGSLLAFHPDIPVVVISWDLTEAQERHLSGVARVVPRRPDLPDDPLWGRLGIFHLDLTRAIYLDADTIVLGPIDALFSVEAPFAAARNMGFMGTIGENFTAVRPLVECGIDPAAPAFNSGVLSIDVPYWGTRLYDELLELHARYGQSFLLGDQSAFQIAFQRPAHPLAWLPREYNVLAGFWDWQRAPREPRIVHYAGHSKPWWPGCAQPAMEHFFRYSKIPRPRA